MDNDELEKSKSGAPIYRYDSGRKRSRIVGGASESVELINAHIQQYVGEVSEVFHELVSDLVHIDINSVDPTQNRPYFTLITSGMSDIRMAAPDGFEEFGYAELMICLPSDWPLSGERIKDEKHYWPMRILKYLARLPHAYDTWLWATHTIPNGDPPEPFAKNTKLSGVLVMYPSLMPEGFSRLKVSDQKELYFLSLLPIYKEEMDFKLDKGLDPLIDKLDKANVTELLDILRPNVCKRSFLGL